MKFIKRALLKKYGKIHPLMLLHCSIHYVLKRNIDNDQINRETPTVKTFEMHYSKKYESPSGNARECE